MERKRFSGPFTGSFVRTAWQQQLLGAGNVDRNTSRVDGRDARFPLFRDYYVRLHALPRRWRRGIGRKFHRSLAEVAFLLALGSGTAFSATLDVDGTRCTLADAITAANTDTAAGGCAAGSGADTLVLPTNSRIVLTPIHIPDFPSYVMGLPIVTSVITIEGNGSTIEPDRMEGTPEFRNILFVFREAGDLTLNDATVSGPSISGVTNIGGRLTLNDCVVTGHSEGGVVALGSAHATEINRSLITGNDYGVFGDDFSIDNSTISGNAAAGVFVDRGAATLSNSTVSGNGHGVYAYNPQDNQMICTVAGPLTIQRSLVVGNTQEDVVAYNRDCVEVISDNNLFGDRSKTGSEAFYGFVPGPTDITATLDGTDPTVLGDILDATLLDNGGPTRTQALVPGSPAVDAAWNCPPPDTDQRGVERPQGIGCDIGAYELKDPAGEADLAISKSVYPRWGRVGEPLTYTLTVRNNGPDRAAGVKVMDRFRSRVEPVSLPQGCKIRRGRIVSCRLDALRPGEDLALELGVTPTQAGRLGNTVSVRSSALDPDRSDNRARLVVRVME